MERIQNESTALSSMGLNIDLILNGECLEFDPAKKIDRKKSYTELEPVVQVIDMYTKDLRQCYMTIEQMEQELAAGERKFGDAERRLAELMASVEQLRKSHEEDGATIEKLQQQVKDAQELADTVPAMAEDVQYVLDALERSLADHGMSLDDILQEE